ncbi:hypothetical protein RHSIM_Rhsim01G0159100 [Rhododendron simsii]|uniref:Uncharacterized protein n=1 Tax=Rhododendron simsii TaxID=118357 RepID=A0A834LWI2_RHOSS|nr:hypothetical protein RHSIM_Rhsim01G0159100 [Rhododendron simsii]
MSRPMEMALVSVLNPLPQSSIILGVTIFDQPSISPEVIETATQSIDDVQIPSMPIDDSTSELNEETKDEVKSFFRMSELPLSEISTVHFPAFTSWMNQLITKKVLPLS